MKTENKSIKEYWNEVERYFGIHDTIRMVNGIDEWEGDEVIEFRDSCGCLLSCYNVDKAIVEYY